jgi:cytochrome c-type biogenesis protein CcmH/NrfF
MTNEGLGYQRDYNAQFVVAKLKTRDDKTGEQFLITPMRSKFSHDEQWFNEIGIHSTWWHDLYVVLTFFDPQNESVSLKLSWNPLVKLVWTSVVMMIFGAFVSLTQHFDLSKVWQKKEPSQSLKKISSFFILFFLFAMTLFTFSGICYGQENILKKTNFVSQNVPAISDDSQLADVAKELRCPTCQGLSILESDTLQSKAMRTEIESQLDLGKTKKEIIDYFKKSYGPWILREPDSHSFVGFLIWFIPILIFVLGPLAIFVFFKNFKKKEIDIRNKLREEIKTFIQEKKTENHL